MKHCIDTTTSAQNEYQDHKAFLRFIGSLLERRTHFELAQAYFNLYLKVGLIPYFWVGSDAEKVHGEEIIQQEELRALLASLQAEQV